LRKKSVCFTWYQFDWK